MDGSNLIMPDREIAQRFVSTLTADDTHPGAVRLRFVHDRDRRMPAMETEGYLTDARVWDLVREQQAAGYAVYYTVNEIRTNARSGKGGMSDDTDVVRIRALCADFDNGLLADDWEYHKQPHFIVRTSFKGNVQRGQCLWMVRDFPVANYKQRQREIAAHYGTDRSVQNPSRVFRLPGSLHLKREPQLVTFEMF
jgi:hypothetical protein